MKPFDSINIKTGIKEYNRFSLNASHKTTMDFMVLQPIYYRHLIPGQSISVDLRTFIRMAAMPVPTFGDASLHLSAYFVPYRQVCPYFDSFITDSVYVPHNGQNSFIPSRVPVFANSSIVELFSNTSYGYVSTATGTTFDIKVKTSASASSSFNFTPDGRQVFKVLTALGYRFQWTKVSGVSQTFNALPILCFLRAYLDYYWPYQYRDLPEYKVLETLLRYDTEHTYTTADLRHILDVVPFVCYANDYFTAAFDNPTGPRMGDTSPVAVDDRESAPFTANQIGTYAYSDSAHSAAVIASDLEEGNSGVNAISQNSLNWLRRITDYLRRHQLAGSRAIDRFLARYGVKPSNVAMDRAYRIGSATVPMTVLDQMSTASTSDAHLGDYAGKGYIMDIDDNLPNFSYKSDSDFGMFFIVGSLIPSIGYVQGNDRHNIELSRLDFFNPEYDALGCQAIDSSELYQPLDGTEMTGAKVFGNIFGFIPRDAHRKVAKDWLTGDYILGSHNQSGDVSPAWHLNRLFSPESFDAATPDEISHSPNFIFGEDASQYDRVFYNGTNSADHFYADFYFKVTSKAPMKRLFDFVDFDEDEHNRDVTLNVSQVN